MKVLSIEDYNDFECIGTKCPLSCCSGGWRIDVDKCSGDYYQSVEGDFGDKLRDSLSEIENGFRFKMTSAGNCPFLNDDKLCEIYRNLGEDKLCYICKTYPRQEFSVGDILFRYLTTSCPEVTRRIIQRKERLQVDYADVTNIKLDFDGTNWEKFNQAIQVYTAGMKILQNRNLIIRDRLALLMLFVNQFQETVLKEGNPTAIISLFSTPDLYTVLLQDIPMNVKNYESKIKVFEVFCLLMKNLSGKQAIWGIFNDLYINLCNISNVSIHDLDLSFEIFNSDEIQIELEQLLAYRYFTAFMKGYEKQDYYERLVSECMTFIAFLCFVAFSKIIRDHAYSQEERILLFSLISRVDHNYNVDNKLKELMDVFVPLNSLFELIS